MFRRRGRSGTGAWFGGEGKMLATLTFESAHVLTETYGLFAAVDRLVRVPGRVRRKRFYRAVSCYPKKIIF
jgi:hypothetical protein